MKEFDPLKLENQLCFPLYVTSKETIRLYQPFLKKIGLTYTQYITMLVLWEKKEVNVKELGKCLYLDSGTLTPLLKKLEIKGYIEREKSKKDERNLIVSLTKEGMKLKKRASSIPIEMAKCVNLSEDESLQLYTLLYKLLNK